MVACEPIVGVFDKFALSDVLAVTTGCVWPEVDVSVDGTPVEDPGILDKLDNSPTGPKACWDCNEGTAEPWDIEI